jgi:hypothetical protein
VPFRQPAGAGGRLPRLQCHFVPGPTLAAEGSSVKLIQNLPKNGVCKRPLVGPRSCFQAMTRALLFAHTGTVRGRVHFLFEADVLSRSVVFHIRRFIP